MKCSEPLRHLGTVDIGPFAAALAAQPDALWDADVLFQRQIAPYRKTRTIYLLMTLDGLAEPPRAMAGWQPLGDAFQPIAAKIASRYPRPGRVLNAQVALLGPGVDIASHIDKGPILEVSHRVHVPLETHPGVEFIVEGKNYPLAVGEIYELDNMRRHAVRNGSPHRRIHLVVDYYEEPAG